MPRYVYREFITWHLVSSRNILIVRLYPIFFMSDYTVVMRNKKLISHSLVVLALLLVTSSLYAARVIQVQALFSNKAVVSIDGTRHVLSVDKPGPDGIKLLSATSREAVLEVDGKRSSFPLGNQISTNFTPAQEVKEQIWQDNGGMYSTVGSINGMPVTFLVDTGASLIAMNSSQAKRLGIDYRLTGKPPWVTTA